MLSALGWLIAIIGFAGGASCIALQGYFVWRANIDPDTKADSQNKFMLGLAACFGFFLIGIVGVILLHVSGAYDAMR
jgi:hypothetical protein